MQKLLNWCHDTDIGLNLEYLSFIEPPQAVRLIPPVAQAHKQIAQQMIRCSHCRYSAYRTDRCTLRRKHHTYPGRPATHLQIQVDMIITIPCRPGIFIPDPLRIHGGFTWLGGIGRSTHPAMRRSRVNRKMANSIRDLQNVTSHDLYEEYAEFDIDVATEQTLLIACEAELQNPA